jgi:hypothetical protein
VLAGCSETPTKTAEKKKEAEKPEPIGGQSAIYKMYQMARSWAPDAQVLKMNSMALTEVPDPPKGTAAAWQATFVSSARGQARPYTWSSIEGEGNLHKGVFALNEEGWSGRVARRRDARRQNRNRRGLQDRARQRQAEFDKKNPGKPIVPAGKGRQARQSGMARDLGQSVSQSTSRFTWTPPPATSAKLR